MPEDETTLRMPISLRDRLKIVAAQERCNMREWIKRRVTDAERSDKKGH